MRRKDVSSRAIMVNDVPEEARSDEQFAGFFRRLFPDSFHRCCARSAAPPHETAHMRLPC